MPKRRTVVYVVAGPNGAGKTTFAMRYLPRIAACRNFINADLIAQGLSPLDLSSAETEAGRLYLRRIAAMIDQRQDFAFETTLSGRGYARTLQSMRAAGYEIVLFYLWIPSAEFSTQRVASRVQNGGHDVPADAISRRYLKSLRNLFEIYMPIADRTVVLDNSSETPRAILEKRGRELRVRDPSLYGTIMNQIGGQHG